MNFIFTKNRNGAIYIATTENNLVLKILLTQYRDLYKQETYIAKNSGGIFISFTPTIMTENEFKKLAVNIS